MINSLTKSENIENKTVHPTQERLIFLFSLKESVKKQKNQIRKPFCQ